MAVTIKQTEAIPESYPAVTVSDAASPFTDTAWQRLESYIAHRFTARAATWVVEGPGEWCPPLTPATITTAEIWNGAAWETITADPAPLGLCLTGDGPYRFTANVGGGTAPAAVIEACRRLAEYLSGEAGTPGASTEKVNAGPVGVETTRSPAWLAKAMENSGAADLLRPYRRA